MKQFPILFCLVLAAQLQAAKERKLDPLPVPVSNNAVAISHDGGKTRIFSFMGIGPKKTWNAITTRAFELDPNAPAATEKSYEEILAAKYQMPVERAQALHLRGVVSLSVGT